MEHRLETTDGNIAIVARSPRADGLTREFLAVAAESVCLDLRVYFDALAELSLVRGVTVEEVAHGGAAGRSWLRVKLV